MNTCHKILMCCAFSAVFLSLALGCLASFGLGMRPDATLAAVVTCASFTLMMAVAINWAYRAGQMTTSSNAEGHP